MLERALVQSRGFRNTGPEGARTGFESLLIAQHVVFIQAKFHDIDNQLRDQHIPWEKVVPMLRRAGYSGYLSSEYEGNREPWRSLEQVRRQHALLRKLERKAAAAT